MLTIEEISRLADKVLGDALRGDGYNRVSVRADVDHEDVPALFIEAILKEKTPAVSGEVYSKALSVLRDALLERDEARFPYLRLVHPDDAYADEPNAGVAHRKARRAHG